VGATRAVFVIVIAGLLLSGFSNSGKADELTQLYEQVLKDPANIELNLRYARMAEERGEAQRALAAYERIIDIDPGNQEAQQALLRVGRKLQPNFTQAIVELGGGWESNPRRVPVDKRSDWEVLARAAIKDERNIGDFRWRTVTALQAEIHRNEGDLTYGYGAIETGPVFDLKKNLAVHAAIGGGGAYFDHRSLYNEGALSLNFESTPQDNVSHILRLRGGYRVYNDFFPATEGYFAEAVLRSVYLNVLAANDVFMFSPWIRSSGVGGTGFSVVSAEEIIPGRYFEYGGKLEYYRRVIENVSLGGYVSVNARRFAVLNDFRREDLLLIPGAAAIIHQILGTKADLRFDYRFEHNHSNDPSQAYPNHILTLLLVARY
jgi:tetratricopeptide (TPR) repeat protein